MLWMRICMIAYEKKLYVCIYIFLHLYMDICMYACMHVCIIKNHGLYDWYARWVPAWTLCNNKVGMSVSLPGSGASESASTRRRGVLPSNSANGSSLSRLFGHIVMRRQRFWFSRGKWFPGNRKMQRLKLGPKTMSVGQGGGWASGPAATPVYYLRSVDTRKPQDSNDFPISG